MPILLLDHITKRYAETPALDNISFSVERGEFYGLLGPSGCGKTTLLRVVAGLEIPQVGTIHFEGHDITHVSPERRGFGLVFQNYALFPHLNVLENVSFALRARGIANDEVIDRAKNALGLVQLPGFEKRKIRELSGGQQQRVAIARAISTEPALLLFDEPLSNLDVSLREETRRELRDLISRLDLTAIYVTHDQDDAFALCDRISVMGAGRILQTGTPRDLYDRPALISVAQFLGRNNLVPAMRVSSMKSENGVFKTLVGGHTLQARVTKKDLGPVNKPCTLAIRPEHVRLHDPRSPERVDSNNIPAILREVRFAGSTAHAVLDAGGLAIEALLLSDSEFRPGMEFIVSIQPDQIRVLSD
jgi:ABC-type Fe3+/spermidine/putrescine transport system ATPase subunit